MANIFNSVLIASFWGGCFTVLFMLINKLFKNKLPVSWHYYVWLVVIVRMLVPVFIPISVEPNETAAIVNQVKDVLQVETTINTFPIIDDFEKMTVTQADNTQAENRIIPLSAKDTTVNIVNQIFQASNFWVIWLVIAAMLVANKFSSYFLYIKKLKSNCILPSEDEIDIFSKQRESLGIKGNVAFFKYKGAQTPFAIGLFKFMVILPDKKYSDTQLNYIFHHELMHIKRHDMGVKWLCEIAKAIHWFNPLVYIAAKNASFYCEASCDAVVLKNRTSGERKEYGIIILDIIGQAVNQKTPMCVSMYSNKSNLKKRIQYILNSGQVKKSISLSVTIAIIIFALCACSSIQLKEVSLPESVDMAETTIDRLEDVPVLTKVKTNLLIAGVDDAGDVKRADTIIIASFDTTTNQISLLSIPRDTYLVPSEETISKLQQQGIEIPTEIRFGEITAYTQAYGMEYLQKEISRTLGIPIDYYIKMDISAFQKIVDAAGGVDMTIPEGGLYYSDPSQALEIALDGGTQHLDGEKAMMLVRYRSTYKNGDLDRISVQQQFLQALYSKLITGDNLIEKASALLSILTENTETNLSLKDFTPYLQYIPKMNADSMQIFQLPIGTERMNERFYVIIDYKEFESSIVNVFI